MANTPEAKELTELQTLADGVKLREEIPGA